MTGFDRIKPPDRRLLERPEERRPEAPGADRGGRAGLFSAGRPTGGGGSPPLPLQLRCSGCDEVSTLDARTAVRSAAPLFLVAPWRSHPVFAVCPACRGRRWLKVELARDEA